MIRKSPTFIGTHFFTLAVCPFVIATAMVRPSQRSRKARRAHEREQDTLRKQNLPSCQGCNLCSATKAREIEKAKADAHIPTIQRQEHKQSTHSKLRQFLKKPFFGGDILIVSKHTTSTEAASQWNIGTEQDHMLYWTDASRLKDSSCGISMTYRSSAETWVELSWSVRASNQMHVL